MRSIRDRSTSTQPSTTGSFEPSPQLRPVLNGYSGMRRSLASARIFPTSLSLRGRTASGMLRSSAVTLRR
jgi:hypothetical protein